MYNNQLLPIVNNRANNWPIATLSDALLPDGFSRDRVTHAPACYPRLARLTLRTVVIGALLMLTLLSVLANAQEPRVTMGNGAENWIVTEGTTRDDNTFVFAEVNIAGNGWLVMHPFEDGKPNGEVVAGYTAVSDGLSTSVSISVDPAPSPGDMFIVMLHSDANHNGEFDFVFVNEREVVDAAVFEGQTMIGHVYRAP